MVVIEVQVKLINSVKQMPDYCLMDKQEAQMEIVEEALNQAAVHKPFLLTHSFVLTFDKKWDTLPDKVYMYSYEGSYGFGIAKRTRKKSESPVYASFPIYLVFNDVEELTEKSVYITYAYD